MKKEIHIFIEGNKFSVPVYVPVIMMIFLLMGIICGQVTSGTDFFISDFFAPFSLVYTGGDLLFFILRNFTTFGIYALVGFFMSLSLLGFMVTPFICAFLGLSISYSANYFLAEEQWLNFFVCCLPVWSIFSAILLIYFSISFSVSANLFKAYGLKKQASEDFSIIGCSRILYYMALFTAAFSLISSIIQFLFVNLVH